MESLGDLFPGGAITAQALDAGMPALGHPEQQDNGEEQQDQHPRKESASHGFGCERVAGRRYSA